MDYAKEADKIRDEYDARRVTFQSAVISFLWLLVRMQIVKDGKKAK